MFELDIRTGLGRAPQAFTLCVGGTSKKLWYSRLKYEASS
jgi:hypothetical protein